MYQEVFVFVAVNLGEASGDRDIDFSLNLNRLRYFASPTDIFDSIQLFVQQYKTFPYSCDKLHDMHNTIRLYIVRVKRMALSLSLSLSTNLHLLAEKRYAHKETVTSSSILFNEIHPEKWKQPFH